MRYLRASIWFWRRNRRLVLAWSPLLGMWAIHAHLLPPAWVIQGLACLRRPALCVARAIAVLPALLLLVGCVPMLLGAGAGWYVAEHKEQLSAKAHCLIEDCPPPPPEKPDV